MDVVATDLDVARDEARDRRVTAAEHDVLAGAHEGVVHDLVWTRAVASPDGLLIKALPMALGEVAVADLCGARVEPDAAAEVRIRLAVDVHPVEHQVVRLRGYRRGAAIAEVQETVVLRMQRRCHCHLEADQPPSV